MSGFATNPRVQPLVYVVDDEESLLDIAELALRADGYSLKVFRDPQAAFEAFTHEPSKPSLLLTDYAMTPFDGIELSAKCKSAHPGLKVLLVSGTVHSTFALQAGSTIDEFIAKPYQPEQLARTVKSMLGTEAV